MFFVLFLDHPLGDLSVHADAAPDGEKFLLIIRHIHMAVCVSLFQLSTSTVSTCTLIENTSQSGTFDDDHVDRHNPAATDTGS